jgi:hypothetical protein
MARSDTVAFVLFAIGLLLFFLLQMWMKIWDEPCATIGCHMNKWLGIIFVNLLGIFYLAFFCCCNPGDCDHCSGSHDE